MIRISSLFAVLSATAVACGGSRSLPPVAAVSPGSADAAEPVAAPEPPAIVREFPALALLPGRPAWVVAASRLDEGRHLVRELLRVGTLTAPAPWGLRPSQIDASWRAAVEASPLERAGLVALGLDPDRSAAAFGAPVAPGVVLPVTDRQRVASAAARLRPNAVAARVAEDGREWASWALDESAHGEWHVSYALDDDWLVVFVGRGAARASAPPAIGWDVATAAIDSADAWARRVAGDGRSAFGWADPGGLAAGAALGPDWRACAIGVAGEFPGLKMSSLVSPSEDARDGDGDWSIALELDVADLEQLAALEVGAPPPGWPGYANTAGLGVDVGFDLGILERFVRRMGCEAAADEVAGVARQLRRSAGAHAVRAAVEHLSSDVTRLRGAAWLEVSDPRPLRSALGRVPGFLQRSRRVGGYRVRVINVPMVPFVAYVDGGREFAIAAGEGIIERVLAPTTAPVEPALAGLALRPDSFRDPGEAIRTVASLAKVPGVTPVELDRRLRDLFARYQVLWARAFIAEGRLQLRVRGRERVSRPRASF